MAERIEALKEKHLDDCAHLYVSTFNAQPWNQRWTLETAHKKLAWTMGVPGFLGWVFSLDEGIAAFAAGYRQQEDEGAAFTSPSCASGQRRKGQAWAAGSRLTWSASWGSRGSERFTS